MHKIHPEWAESYPNFFSFIKYVDRYTRPKRMQKEHALKFIEEIYTKKFQYISHQLLSQIKICFDYENSERFPDFVYKYIQKKHNYSHKAIDEFCVNLLLSLEFYKTKSICIDIFIDFLSEKATSEDLVFFLFVRNIIEKHIAVDIYQEKINKFIDLELVLFSQVQYAKVISMIYGPEDKQNI